MILYILYEVSHVRDPVLHQSQGGTGEGKYKIQYNLNQHHYR